MKKVGQNIEQVVNEHGPVALEHLNNIATELKTKHISKLMNEADKFAQDALTVHIPKAREKLEQAKEEGVPIVVQWVKDHPGETVAIAGAGYVAAFPVLVTAPMLWGLGFGGLGPVGGKFTV